MTHLMIRLRNWVGDVTLGVPMLQRLHDAGFVLHLVGRRWAADLLRGHGWPVEPLARGLRGRVRQLRALRRLAQATDPGFDGRINAIALPFSFSSALEMRLAGLHAIGYAHEGRSPLLTRALPRPAGAHELEVYWQLGDALLGAAAPPPQRIDLRVAAADQHAAQALCERHRIGEGFIVICPFAGGTFEKIDKTWPGFADFVAHRSPVFGRRVVVCPGPGEEAQAHAHFGSAVVLDDVALGTYAALLQRAALMISNDTGPGHIAAAVGTPTLSVLGPTDPVQWRAWGPTVRVVRGPASWPEADEVEAAVTRMLAAPAGS